MNPSPLHWGIIGTGGIAHTFARALARSRTGKLVAVGSRQTVAAEAFAREFAGIRAHGSYEGLLGDPAVEAVYISTPHPFHAEWAIKAARAKKHILCEKPLTLNHAEAVKVVEAARENSVFLMEAFMYRCHPQTARLIDLIRDGAIGEIGTIHATFSFNSKSRPESRLLSNALGGGGILDVGCYTLSAARLIAGVATGLPFANPVKLSGVAHFHPKTDTDLYSQATALFPSGILAQLACGVGLTQENGLKIFGSKGSIHLALPFVPAIEGGENTILLKREGADMEKITITTDSWLYALEADAVTDALRDGSLESPYMPIADTLGNMAALDAWRLSIGLVYDSEKANA